DMIKKMVAQMARNIDVAVCNFSTTNIPVPGTAGRANTRTLAATDALEDLMYQRFITCSPWAKLYRAQLFDEIRFPSGKINQDFGTTYKVLAKAKKVLLLDEKMYVYTYRPDSIINSSFSPKRMAGLE